MSTNWQVPRNGLAWLLLALAAVISLHMFRMPAWVMLGFIACAAWRWMVFSGRWSFPQRQLRWLLAVAALGGIYLSYGSWLGLEPTVALLIAGCALKLLETNAARDCYLLIFLCFFIVLGAFLFDQGLFASLAALAAVGVVVSALIALHQTQIQRFRLASSKLAALLLLQALPVTLVLFVVVPRINPLWQVPSVTHRAMSGVSDSMEPGSISDLAQNDALAFRVEFIDSPPAKSDMYWRGLVLSNFDGIRWQPAFNYQDASVKPLLPSDTNERVLQYRVILEPSYSQWLYAMPVASVDPAVGYFTKDYRLQSKKVLTERIRYDVTSVLGQPFETSLSPFRRKLETRLPGAGNAKARAMAEQWAAETGDTLAIVERALSLFRQQAFFYTLTPPLLTSDSRVDEFLFTSRQGFCEHYASSFVFLMRAAGIPARVVTGYQGGEFSPVTNALLVHQYDAHAWAEVWLDGRGWQRVDPTAAVAPERVSNGLRSAVNEDDFLVEQPLSAVRLSRWVWLNRLRLRVDALEYYWASAVLGYQEQQQLSLLKKLLGEVSALRIALVLGGVAAVVALWAMMPLLASGLRRRQSKPQRLLAKACQLMAAYTGSRCCGETASDYAQRVRHAPNLSHEVKMRFESVVALFIELEYAPVDVGQRSALTRAMNQSYYRFRWQLMVFRWRNCWRKVTG